MKKSISIIAISIMTIAVLIIPAMSVLASSGGPTHHSFETGRDFGQHISDMAQAGHLGEDMNPGTHHQGFSSWTPGN